MEEQQEEVVLVSVLVALMTSTHGAARCGRFGREKCGAQNPCRGRCHVNHSCPRYSSAVLTWPDRVASCPAQLWKEKRFDCLLIEGSGVAEPMPIAEGINSYDVGSGDTLVDVVQL